MLWNSCVLQANLNQLVSVALPSSIGFDTLPKVR